MSGTIPRKVQRGEKREAESPPTDLEIAKAKAVLERARIASEKVRLSAKEKARLSAARAAQKDLDDKDRESIIRRHPFTEPQLCFRYSGRKGEFSIYTKDGIDFWDSENTHYDASELIRDWPNGFANVIDRLVERGMEIELPPKDYSRFEGIVMVDITSEEAEHCD